MVDVRLQEQEKPRKRRSPVNMFYSEYMSDLSLTLAGVFTRLIPEGLRRWHLSIAKQTGGLQMGRHSKLERHGYLTLNHTVVLWGIRACRLLAGVIIAVGIA